MKPKLEHLHDDFLGIFLWFLAKAWNPLTRLYWIHQLRKTVRRSRDKQASFICGFLWLCDNKPEHHHLNNKTPWKFEKKPHKVFDFTKPNKKFWDIYRLFLKALKSEDMEFWPSVEMDRYCYYPFRHNSNGVRGFWSNGALKHHLNLMKKVCQVMRSVYGEDYQPPIKMINEPIHGGDHNKFHVIGRWHVEMWEKALKNYTKLPRIILDVSHCEAAAGEFDKRRKCHVCGKWQGNDDYLDADGFRQVIPGYHGVSIIENLKTEDGHGFTKMRFLTSAWKKVKFSEDGGAGGLCDIARGYRIPGTNFCEGDAKQVKEMLIYLWGESKKHGKVAIWGLFPMEAFMDDDRNWTNPIKENYKLGRIGWGRQNKALQAHKTVYG